MPKALTYMFLVAAFHDIWRQGALSQFFPFLMICLLRNMLTTTVCMVVAN